MINRTASAVLSPHKGVSKVVYVYTKPMPGYCKAMVAPNADGSFTIVINEALSYAERIEAYKHEMRHIKCGHFDIDCILSIDEMEREADAQEEG